MDKTSLGDRMKGYENISRNYLMRRNPVVVRVDGKAFHTVTRGLKKPFDDCLVMSMVGAACSVAQDMQGCKLLYTQSDEVSFLLVDYDALETQGWFDYNLNKIVSVSASAMTYYFNKSSIGRYLKVPAMFDSRAFSIPRNEVSNYFLWRAKDWERNSLQMYSRAFFSHKELVGKGRADMHEMLHGAGKNWTNDLEDRYKNGTFWVRTEEGWTERVDVMPTFDSVNSVVKPLVEVGE